jgi:hypothetical protein
VPFNDIKFDPETISVALFNLLQMQEFPFAKYSRKGAIWSNVSAEDQPYCALIEVGGKGVQDSAIGLEKWQLRYLILVYIRADAEGETVPATTLNAALRSVFDVISSAPFAERQTLGGLVNNCWMDGWFPFNTGILADQIAVGIDVVAELGL